VVADNFAADANAQTVSVESIPDGWMGLDIGPDEVKVFVPRCPQAVQVGDLERADGRVRV